MSGTQPASPRFLVSVRSPEEALIALTGGADIVDVKEPARGALGAVPLPVVRAVIAAVAARAPVSATVGDCALGAAAGRARAIAGAGVDYVKLGFFGEADRQALDALERCAAGGIRLIAVLFADQPRPDGLVTRLAQAGFAGVMLDTMDKRGGGLRHHLGPEALAGFLGAARRHGLSAGLAGSLRAEDVAALLPLRPDVLGFRGALCGGAQRAGALDPSRVAAMRGLIPRPALTGRERPNPAEEVRHG